QSPYEIQVFVWCERIVQRCVFRYVPDAALNLQRFLPYVESQYENFTFEIGYDARKDLDRSALARTIRADVADHLTGVDLKANVVQHRKPVENFCKVCCGDDGCGYRHRLCRVQEFFERIGHVLFGR